MSPYRQDRFATVGPVVAVLLFLAAILASITYLRLEEGARELETVTRDVEYAQQRLRLRLLERQEQLMRLAQALGSDELAPEDFAFQAEQLLNQYPELLSLAQVTERNVVKQVVTSPSAPLALLRRPGDALRTNDTNGALELAHDLGQPVYSHPIPHEAPAGPTMQLHLPLSRAGLYAGTLMAEYSIDGLYRYGIPPEVMARYTVSLLDGAGQVLAGGASTGPASGDPTLSKLRQPPEHAVPVSPVGNGLVLRAQGFRTSQDIVGSGLLWVVAALSVLTLWMLVGVMRHTRRRIEAQQALLAETGFRRAMENSMLTGMRALDLSGRITYVNPAFCQMTGWREDELVGQVAPFPYWPEEDYEMLNSRLQDELQGRSTPGGFEVRVRRKNGTLFDARMYVSPLVDVDGTQSGWMTSMTDITEPKRIRSELSASYERFTTVLESLDAAVSVAPLGSRELLFANKLYRLWFGARGDGHLQLVERASRQPASDGRDTGQGTDGDSVDDLAGLPTDPLLDAQSENAEVYVDALDKWLEVRTRYLSWVDGRLAQMVIASDISPRRRAEEQAARQAERAQAASRLITMGEMASSVAHELNQPLTAIVNYCNGMVSRIQKQQINAQDMQLALEKTARQAQRAGQIIQRIRAFVRRSEPNPTPSDVQTMVGNGIELMDIELRRQQIRLITQIAPGLPKLTVDPILIEQVLINLIKNAGESIQQAGVAPGEGLVEVRALPTSVDGLPVIEFSVTDNGRGVPDQVMERIYEAFYSTKAEGMGIGLKLCRSIVEAHHGRMQVRNLYNEEHITGCCFSFWIPSTSGAPAGRKRATSPA